MSWNFDLEAAINQIATFEQAITTPTPGIVNSFNYGLNPSEINAVTDLPAVVHIPLGPQLAAGGSPSGRLSGRSTFEAIYTVQSTMLLVQTVLGQYPAEESASNLFWKQVFDKFLNFDNQLTLATAADVHTYNIEFATPSYTVRPWPPVPNSTLFYWSLQYNHIFKFEGG